MSILNQPKAAPKAIIFDWHATLVDTHDAMYYALDAVLPKLDELDLTSQIIKLEDSKTVEDAKLVKYIMEHRKLHPKIKSARKISRTDIFELLFGNNDQAKKTAHAAFDKAYRNYYGHVTPLEKNFESVLRELKSMNLLLGVLSNRSREFLEREISNVEGHDWNYLFNTLVCGDDVAHRKPAPDLILKACQNINLIPHTHIWYVGDSTTDIIAANNANVTAIFYNAASWDQDWIDKIFPDTVKHPHTPDGVVHNCHDLLGLVKYYKRIYNNIFLNPL